MNIDDFEEMIGGGSETFLENDTFIFDFNDVDIIPPFHTVEEQESKASNKKNIRKRFPPETVQEIKRWMFSHARDPYMPSNVKQYFADKFKLTINQVSTLCMNIRSRNFPKPMFREGRKIHYIPDIVFRPHGCKFDIVGDMRRAVLIEHKKQMKKASNNGS